MGLIGILPLVVNTLLLQWGKTAIRTNNGDKSVTYPISYTTVPIVVDANYGKRKDQNESGSIHSYTVTGFTEWAYNERGTYWLSIGY